MSTEQPIYWLREKKTLGQMLVSSLTFYYHLKALSHDYLRRTVPKT